VVLSLKTDFTEKGTKMVRTKRLAGIAALAILMGSVTARAQSLGIGDGAPKMEVKEFVKGEPVKAFEPGKNYVVEFWATWCGPCRTSIPHLTELQKKHPDVTFIGVSIWEQDQAGVKPFVEQMGDKMNYRVAMDAVPEAKDGDQKKNLEGAMAKSWMRAAGRNGIPSAFIVNKDGKIAWMGHPMAMDEPLEKIASGSWDLKAAAEASRKEAEEQAKLEKVGTKLNEALRAGDAQKILTVIDEVIALKPDLELRLNLQLRLPTLIKLDQQDKALELAQKLEKSPIGQQPEGLNMIAWAIVDPSTGTKPSAKLLQLALELARRADEKTGGKNGPIADTLAKAYFDSGDVAKAIETQERAVGLSKKNGQIPAKQIEDMEERLEQYKKAAKK
jgi:thiol-disulfide isomerase/thioredoxin